MDLVRRPLVHPGNDDVRLEFPLFRRQATADHRRLDAIAEAGQRRARLDPDPDRVDPVAGFEMTGTAERQSNRFETRVIGGLCDVLHGRLVNLADKPERDV